MHMHARSGSCIPVLVHACTSVHGYTRSRMCMLTGFGYTRVCTLGMGMNMYAWVYSILASMHEHAHYLCAHTCILIPSVHTRICSYQLWSLLLTLCDPCVPTDMDHSSLPFTVLSSTYYDCLLLSVKLFLQHPHSLYTLSESSFLHMTDPSPAVSASRYSSHQSSMTYTTLTSLFQYQYWG